MHTCAGGTEQVIKLSDSSLPSTLKNILLRHSTDAARRGMSLLERKRSHLNNSVLDYADDEHLNKLVKLPTNKLKQEAYRIAELFVAVEALIDWDANGRPDYRESNT